MDAKQVADIRAHAGDGFGPATLLELCGEIERLRACIGRHRKMAQWEYRSGSDADKALWAALGEGDRP